MALVLVATVGVPAGVAAAPTALYMHLDGVVDFPITTQQPPEAYAASFPYGTATSTATCLAAPSVPFTDQAFHTYYGYGSPTFVDYRSEAPEVRYHAMRGMSYDAELNATDPAAVYWYIETQLTASEQTAGDANAAPMALPQVAMQATIREGDDVSVGDEAFNTGRIIAEGGTGPHLLDPTGSGAPGTLAPTRVADRFVYELAAPLDVLLPRIDANESYNLRIDVYVDGVQGCSDPKEGYLMPNLVRPHTSPDHRPRIELGVENPLQVHYSHSRLSHAEDAVQVLFGIGSPWGPHDVSSDDRLVFVIDGPTEARNVTLEFPSDYHGHGLAPPRDVLATWAYAEDDAKPGVYTATLGTTNRQDSASVLATLSFEIAGSPAERLLATPGAALALVGVALAAVFATRRN